MKFLRDGIMRRLGWFSDSRGLYSNYALTSLGHLSRALAEIDNLWVYDLSPMAGPLRVVLESEGGTIRFVADDPPNWLATALDLS